MGKQDEVRITNVQKDVKRDLKAIAKNEQITLSQLLKPHLRKIRDEYPPEMRSVSPD